MRRIVIIGTALAVLGVAVSAYAAAGHFNTYTASFAFSPTKAGSAKSPVPVAYTLDYAAHGTNGNRTAVLLDIRTKVYGLVAHLNGFPTCSGSKILRARNDNRCPKGALVATGAITADLGPSNNSAAPPVVKHCDPALHVWNGGGRTLWFFFVTTPTHQCGGLPTGATPPYPGTISYQGKYLVLDLPIPPAIDFPTGRSGTSYLQGELDSSHLTFLKHTMKVRGKTVAGSAVVGCLRGKRPFSVTFTDVRNNVKQTDTFNGNARCTK